MGMESFPTPPPRKNAVEGENKPDTTAGRSSAERSQAQSGVYRVSPENLRATANVTQREAAQNQKEAPKTLSFWQAVAGLKKMGMQIEAEDPETGSGITDFARQMGRPGENLDEAIEYLSDVVARGSRTPEEVYRQMPDLRDRLEQQKAILAAFIAERNKRAERIRTPESEAEAEAAFRREMEAFFAGKNRLDQSPQNPQSQEVLRRAVDRQRFLANSALTKLMANQVFLTGVGFKNHVYSDIYGNEKTEEDFRRATSPFAQWVLEALQNK